MSRCLIVAEVGLNHNGSVELAHRMLDAIADAGADAAKFQCYRTSDFIGDRTLLYQGRSQYQMFRDYELPDEAWPELKAHCTDIGIMFFATPTSEERLERLLKVGVPMLKNGSDYLGHLPLIRAMARSGLPTVLSTGMATEAEISDAVRAFIGVNGGELTLLHCTSAYPAAPDAVNLRRMQTLKARYSLPVGFSDHTIGTTAAVAAVALGARMVEKHFTLDQGMDGPDHHFSANRIGLRRLVDSIRLVEDMLGSAEIDPGEADGQARHEFMLSCVAARDLPAGHQLERDDIAFRRPGDGLAPKHAPRLLGQRLTDPVSAGELLR